MAIEEIIDATDAYILKILQENARISCSEISRRVGMVPSGVGERIRKLEERGIIEGYTARLNPKSLQRGLLAFVAVRTAEAGYGEETARMLAAIPEVQEVHHVAGEDCFLVKIRAADTEELGRVLREKFSSSGLIRSTRTTIVLETIKQTSELPIDSPAREVCHD